jgi:hypothetical protein
LQTDLRRIQPGLLLPLDRQDWQTRAQACHNEESQSGSRNDLGHRISMHGVLRCMLYLRKDPLSNAQ